MATEKHTRTSYPKGKQDLYQQMLELPKSYNVIALSKVNKVTGNSIDDDKKKIPQRYYHKSNKK